jgi:hypothetical protein
MKRATTEAEHLRRAADSLGRRGVEDVESGTNLRRPIQITSRPARHANGRLRHRRILPQHKAAMQQVGIAHPQRHWRLGLAPVASGGCCHRRRLSTAGLPWGSSPIRHQRRSPLILHQTGVAAYPPLPPRPRTGHAKLSLLPAVQRHQAFLRGHRLCAYARAGIASVAEFSR